MKRRSGSSTSPSTSHDRVELVRTGAVLGDDPGRTPYAARGSRGNGRLRSPAVLVWLASYPRSGNTFFRVVAHGVLGLPTASAYDVDGPAARAGAERLGALPRPTDLADLDRDDRLWLVHTHKQPKADAYRAIHLVRDGRDALVSRAHQLVERGRPTSFREAFLALVDEPLDPAAPSAGSWGSKVLSWLDRAAPTQLVRFEDLVADPAAVVERAVAAVAPGMTRRSRDVRLPSFAELHEHDPGFFRRGATGSHRDELDDDLQERFWSVSANAEAMARLGYPRSTC
jgi:hypothetical protein